MADLLLPGAHRAAGVLDDAAVLTGMLRVEETWSQVLAAVGAAPAAAALDDGELASLVGLDGPSGVDSAVGTDDRADVQRLAHDAEASGNPVVPLVALARRRLREAGREEAALWLHRGLTSQDVLDTTLVLGLRDAVGRVVAELREQAAVLRHLARVHRDDVMAGRTLTQHAVPTTFGLVAAGWLHAVLDAEEGLLAAAAALPAQVSGAAGTLAGVSELLGAAHGRPAGAQGCATDLAERLGLRPAPPWHGRRRPLTVVADALVTCTDAWGAVASTVLVLTRPEVAEVREGRGGGSSTMPHKANPVLSALVRRAALLAPQSAAGLHTAAALVDDQRAAGPWHAEWPLLRDLARTAVVAASQTTELLAGLVVDTGRMRATAEAAADDLLAEQRSLREVAGDPVEHDGDDIRSDDSGSRARPQGYLGAAGALVDGALQAAVTPFATREATHGEDPA